MTVKVSWDNEDRTTIRYDFEGYWIWKDFYAAAETAFAMTRSVDYRVDSISYFRVGATLPPNALMHFRKAMVNAPKNRGVNVIVGGSMFIRTMVKVFSRLNRALGERLVLADTLEDAREVLTARRK
jgi:hypothetical protein